MLYHDKVAEALAPDAPSQLIEMTFRDAYLATLPTAPSIPDSEKHALANYDVSHVDSMLLPVAMEAANVPVPIPNDPKPPIKAYGWIGAKLTYPQIQAAIKASTSNTPSVNGLGQYFGGKGYDKFYFPDEALSGIKLTAVQNLIGDSPLNDVRSSYNNNLYMVFSGGTSPIDYFSGGVTSGTTTLKVDIASVLRSLTVGMQVTSNPPPGQSSDLLPGTTIVQVQPAKGLVIPNQPAIASARTNVHTFQRPFTDDVASKIANLWYSWADYYVANHQVPDVNNVTGSIQDKTRVLTFAAPVTATLVPGMSVTGPGLPAGATTSPVASGRMSVNLSKLAMGDQSNASYSFQTPRPIPRSGEVRPFKLSFAASTYTYTFSGFPILTGVRRKPVPQPSRHGDTK